ncbi:VRR-NUC domain-containing protein [Gammaproteobacteria bacterium]
MPLPEPKRESLVERHLVDRVRRLGGKAYKWVSPANRGVPDRLVILPGNRAFCVECKAPGRRLTPLQENQVAQLKLLGVEVFVAASREDVNRILREARL